MKKIILSLVVLFLVSNCVLMNTLGLNFIKPTIKGSEAKNQILTSALIGAALSGSGGTFATAQATYNTKGIKDNKFYNQKDVDDCAERVLGANAGSAGASVLGVAIGSIVCDPIEEQKTFIDWPIPLL